MVSSWPKLLKKHVAACDQQQSFCSVSAHSQNGVIEQYISVITTHTCTMLLHAMQMWPDVISSEFWSFTFMHTVWIHNCTPWSKEKNSPFTLFTDEDPTHTMNDFKVFGSAVYILNHSLQTRTLGSGKWKECCYQGAYIGHSLHHVINVILIYNPKTRLVSPQYHVIHNEFFKTVQINTSVADVQQNWTSCRMLCLQHLNGSILMPIWIVILFLPLTITLTAAGISPMRPSRLLVQANMPVTCGNKSWHSPREKTAALVMIRHTHQLTCLWNGRAILNL